MDEHPHHSFIDMLLVCSREKALSEKGLDRLVSKLQFNGFASMTADSTFCCGGEHGRTQWLLLSHEHCIAILISKSGPICAAQGNIIFLQSDVTLKYSG